MADSLVSGFAVDARSSSEHQKRATAMIALLFSLFTFSACTVVSTTPNRRLPRENYPAPAYASRRGSVVDGERLRQVMVPLLPAMDHPCPSDQTRVGIINQSDINAANGGNCEFYVTLGLLQRANDDQLRGVLAHEIAHEDLGHVAKAQVLDAGINIGAALLEQLVPGSSVFTPLAGTLIARGYGRTEEYAADKHGVEILLRAGYSKYTMLDALSWIRRVSGDSGGGFLSTHPALDERIAAIQRLR